MTEQASTPAVTSAPRSRGRLLRFVLAAVVIASGIVVWRLVLATPGIPDSRVALSGRIEGDDSAVASKTSGRIAEIRFREGDSVNTTNRCALARSRLVPRLP